MRAIDSPWLAPRERRRREQRTRDMHRHVEIEPAPRSCLQVPVCTPGGPLEMRPMAAGRWPRQAYRPKMPIQRNHDAAFSSAVGIAY